MLSSLRNVKFIKVSKLNMFITVICMMAKNMDKGLVTSHFLCYRTKRRIRLGRSWQPALAVTVGLTL